MDFTKLESFLILAKYQHFTNAANRLYISQPALSKRIRSIEEELGASLFYQVGSQTYLTSQGQAFIKYAEELLSTWNGAKKYIRQFENLEEGELHFGTTHFIGVYILPKIIAKFQEKYPKIKINMQIDSSKNILELLNKNEIEFAFLSDYIEKEDDIFSTHDYLQDELKIIVGNKHPFFKKNEISLEQIKKDKFITKKEDSSFFQFLKNKFHEIPFKNRIVISTQSAIKEAVINNIGISIMSEIAVEREVEHKIIKTLYLKDIRLSRKLQYVYIKNRYLTPATIAFFKILEENKRDELH
ncbi:LysR family transcriptional regulator [Peptoniphilus sp. GNH]|nr:LysR substrate binding domain protein [Clostridiales bacterium KA00134]UHR02431.1 LysR family transcriptional regulator [Peptoniphilus sp. GNH]